MTWANYILVVIAWRVGNIVTNLTYTIVRASLIHLIFLSWPWRVTTCMFNKLCLLLKNKNCILKFAIWLILCVPYWTNNQHANSNPNLNAGCVDVNSLAMLLKNTSCILTTDSYLRFSVAFWKTTWTLKS